MVGRTSWVTKNSPTRFQDDDGKLQVLYEETNVGKMLVEMKRSQAKNLHFPVDFNLIKFVEGGVRRVLSRDKLRIKDEAVKASDGQHVKRIGRLSNQRLVVIFLFKTPFC